MGRHVVFRGLVPSLSRRHILNMTVRVLPLLLFLAACTGETIEPSYFQLRMTNVSLAEGVTSDMGVYTPRFSPGWVRVGGDPLFVEGEAASPDLAFLAEQGDPTGLASSEGSSIPEDFVDTYEAAPLASGLAFTARFEALPGQRLHFASMFIDSNDIIVGANMPLFDGDVPRTGDLTMDFAYYDVGSEVNEAPGFGAGQPGGTGSGEEEAGVVTRFTVMDAAGHRYVALDSLIRLELVTCDTPEC
jgi:hypothetical protein